MGEEYTAYSIESDATVEPQSYEDLRAAYKDYTVALAKILGEIAADRLVTMEINRILERKPDPAPKAIRLQR